MRIQEEIKPFFCIIAGPTGVGKTELAERLAASIGGEIINADMGQFYEPLAIGTAKPDWKNSTIKQYMFDIVTEPKNFSCAAYREQAHEKIVEITERGKIPLIVGGSGFYYQALLWDVEGQAGRLPDGASCEVWERPNWTNLWASLQAIDPERARAIHPNDTYRIARALTIWHSSGVKPSEFKPVYSPVGRCLIIHVTRSREELYARINARTLTMISQGWLDEARALTDDWKGFVRKKKIIGYIPVFDFLEGRMSYSELTEEIQKTTRRYAKRQLTFFGSVKRRLLAADTSNSVHEVDLTLSPIDLYLEPLTNLIKKAY